MRGPDVLPVMIEYMRGLEDGGGQVWADQRLEDEKCVQTHTEEGGEGASCVLQDVYSQVRTLFPGRRIASRSLAAIAGKYGRTDI